MYFTFELYLTENALKSLTVDVIEQLQKAASVIGSEESTVEEKIIALDTILNYVDDIDTANDFCKIGGLFVLLPCLESAHTEIRNKAASIISELAQNNVNCQKQLIEANVLPELVNLLSENETLATSLRAISSIIRGYEPGLKIFIDIGGLECLLGCLQRSNDEKLITRSAFLLNSLCIDFPNICDDLVKLKAIEMIIPLVQPQTDFNVALENLLCLLCSLIEKSGSNDFATNVNFESILKDIIKRAADKSECAETVEYCQRLMRLITKSSEGADR